MHHNIAYIHIKPSAKHAQISQTKLWFESLSILIKWEPKRNKTSKKRNILKNIQIAFKVKSDNEKEQKQNSEK